MKNSEEKENSRDLNKATNLAIASVIGAIIPLVGLILAIIALVISGGVAKNKKNKNKKRTIVTVATIGIILSLFAGLSYFIYSSSVQNQNKKEKACRDAIEAQGDNYYQALLPAGCSDPKKQAESSKKAFNKVSLDLCLNKAQEGYNKYLEINAYKTSIDSEGKKIYYMYQNQWDYINGKLKADKEECYRLYPN